jgi:hypothetical protein
VKLTDSRLLPAAVFAVVLAIGALAAVFAPKAPTGAPGAADRSDEPPPSAAPLDPAEAAIVAPLTSGSDLAGYKVREIQGVKEGVMRVVCAKDQAIVRLQIALAADEGPSAPATTGRYAVFYSAKGTSPQEGERLAKALAKILEGNAAKPPPAGLAPFKPKPKPGTAL